MINVIRKDIESNYEKSKFALVHHYLDSIQPVVENVSHYAVTSSWLYFKGRTFLNAGHYDSAKTYLHQSHFAAKRIGPPNKYLIVVKRALIDYFKHLQQYDSALVYGLEAYHLAHTVDTNQVTQMCIDLSELYDQMGDTANRKKYLFEGYRYCTDSKDSVVLTSNIAKYYIDINKIDSAILYHEKVSSDTSLFSKGDLAARTSNIGTMLTQNGQLKEGISYFKKAIELNRILKSEGENDFYDYTHIYTYLGIAQNYFLQHNIVRSNIYLDTALTLARLHKNYLMLSYGFQDLADNKIAQGRPMEAYSALDSSYTYYSKNDSIGFVENAHELEVKYEAKLKDERITALAFANEVNSRISRQRLIIIFSVIIGAVLLLVVILLLFRRRQMQLQLRENQLQQRLLRTQIEPHFVFNALTILQGFIIQDLKDKAILYLSKFAKLMQISLVNARENYVLFRDEVTALESYLSMQKMHLGDQLNYSIKVYEGYEDDMILIPPMLLQPFVENSVIHGIRHLSDRQGFISVEITRLPNTLYCVIDDNGRGMAHVSRNSNKPSLSTLITQERLEVLSKQAGRQATLSVVDKKNSGEQGLRVILTIPYKMKP